MKNTVLSVCFVLAIACGVNAQKNMKVIVNQPVTTIQPTMWGVFFEDINFGADGGLYAEMVKNRSFEFYEPLMGWSIVRRDASGEIRIINRGEANPSNPRFVRMICKSDTGCYGIANEGFRGMGVQKGSRYNFSVIVRTDDGKNLKLIVELIDHSGNVIGSTIAEGFTSEWKKYEGVFVSTVTDAHARLNILVKGKGTIDMDMVSLFPEDTWKKRPNGLRADLVQMLADLKPGFIRFPGGCIVEGHDLAVRYQWKKTVGPVENRKLIVNRWNTEFMKRHTPDYFQSFGLGFYEYFLLAEDIGAEPLPILNCGMACQFNTGELVPLDELEPYIRDALDLIEFANGSADSKWGKLRMEMGHPGSFHLKYLGIGNEQWGQQYIERYRIFASAIKEKYPEIILVAAAGPSPDGDRFDYLWQELKTLNADLVDEHYYQKPEWFLDNARRYDNYDRNGPKVFAGEYAAHGPANDEPSSRNTWLSALTEAAFMTGLERNAAVVHMTSYAPLFAHVDAWQWRPDLIWFDNLRVVGTPNYYVQKMFSANRGTHVVPILQNGKDIAGEDSLYASAAVDKNNGQLILKLVNAASRSAVIEIELQGGSALDRKAEIDVLASSDMMVYNTPDDPRKIYPVSKSIDIDASKIVVALDASSLNVLRLRYK
jgi:alpha-N-arabinofuranosidase